MEPIDLLMVTVFGIGIVRGVVTGGIKQVLSIAGVIVGLLLAVSLSDPLASQLVKLNWISEALAPAIAFLVIFFAVQLIVIVVSHLLKSGLEAIKLGALDKILGGALGGAKAVLAISLVLFLIRFIGLPGEEQRNNSLFYDVVYPIMPATWDFVVGNAPDLSSIDIVEPDLEAKSSNP